MNKLDQLIQEAVAIKHELAATPIFPWRERNTVMHRLNLKLTEISKLTQIPWARLAVYCLGKDDQAFVQLVVVPPSPSAA